MTSTQHCNFQYLDLVGGPLSLALIFTFHLEHVTEVIVMGERMSGTAFGELGVVEKNNRNGQGLPLATNQS